MSRDALNRNQTSSNFSSIIAREKKGFNETFSRNTFLSINFRDQGNDAYIKKVDDKPEHYFQKSSEKIL
jgi:hypothetical protein